MAAKQTYNYWMLPSDVVYCFKSEESHCRVKGKLWDAVSSKFHDAELQKATDEINDILDSVERSNKDASRHLCFITFQSRLMLVWTQHGNVVGSADSDDDIAQALKIKGVHRVKAT